MLYKTGGGLTWKDLFISECSLLFLVPCKSRIISDVDDDVLHLDPNSASHYQSDLFSK